MGVSLQFGKDGLLHMNEAVYAALLYQVKACNPNGYTPIQHSPPGFFDNFSFAQFFIFCSTLMKCLYKFVI
jgi:hypothetical protein